MTDLDYLGPTEETDSYKVTKLQDLQFRCAQTHLVERLPSLMLVENPHPDGKDDTISVFTI